MISVEQALHRILSVAEPKAADRVVLREALGQVLAEDVASDVDSPPHDKSLVDGYAVSTASLTRRHEGQVELEVSEEVTAGNVPACTVTSGTAIRVMTGAPIPNGADAVVMLEQTRWREEGGTALGVVCFPADLAVREGQNIMPLGKSLTRGQIVLESGAMLGPEHIGLLAEVGRADVSVIPAPRVAVLPTGDELVDPGFVPGPGKIRNSNGPMLIACAQQAGGIAQDLGVGRDDLDQLSERIRAGLDADVLLVAGGVSAGSRDFVPQALAACDVEQVFHKVRLKPGKPLWFGRTSGAGRQGTTFVFGLPGNPVSGFVCFQLFVIPLMQRLAGRGDKPLRRISATLNDDFVHRGDRATYHPARVEDPTDPVVQLVSWHGSSDLRALVDANALAIFPDDGPTEYRRGDQVDCLLIQRAADFA